MTFKPGSVLIPESVLEKVQALMDACRQKSVIERWNEDQCNRDEYARLCDEHDNMIKALKALEYEKYFKVSKAVRDF